MIDLCQKRPVGYSKALCDFDRRHSLVHDQLAVNNIAKPTLLRIDCASEDWNKKNRKPTSPPQGTLPARFKREQGAKSTGQDLTPMWLDGPENRACRERDQKGLSEKERKGTRTRKDLQIWKLGSKSAIWIRSTRWVFGKM